MIEFLFNGFILVIPVLVWNLVFYRTLPLWHQIKIGNNLEKVDSLLRIPIFGLPLVFRFSVFTDIHQIGWVIYGIGIILYFASWIITISGNVNKNQSVLTALGPAYTPNFMVDRDWNGLLGKRRLEILHLDRLFCYFTGVCICAF